ncbi:hypothetical protein [Halocatena halophila]|uniref:hypothetical protein n=1 Tax=Halocatena halophila TaxID=2814576 RepID=UPI002ED3799D
MTTSPKIILTQSPRYCDASRWDEPLCIHKSGGIVGCDSVPLDEFATDPRGHLENYETAVFVGLTEMMTPSNRTDDVWEFTFNQMDMPTVSVDRLLFKTDPWRSWFHFGLVNAKYRDYTYSYLAESDYEQFFNGKTEDNPFSLEEIQKWGDGVIESQYSQYFRTFDVSVDYEADPSEEFEYSELLDDLFQEKNTIGQVRRALEDYCDDIHPDRYLPKRYQLFRGETEWELSITNLPIDQWKASYLQELVDLTDSIAEVFYDE